MRDGSMFATLNEYDEQSYYDGHPQMYLVTPDGGYVVEIFTAFVAKPSESGSDTSPWRLSFKDDGPTPHGFLKWRAVLSLKPMLR